MRSILLSFDHPTIKSVVNFLFAFTAATAILGNPSNAYAACTNPAGDEGTVIYNDAYNVPQVCTGTMWMAMGELNPSAGGSGCSNPAGDEGDIIYNRDHHVLQYCDGDDWKAAHGNASTGGGCPDWYVRAGANCYRLVADYQRPYAIARAVCQGDGGDLAVPADAAEWAIIQQWSAAGPWVGGTDIAVEGTWAWETSSSFAFPWDVDSDQPDGGAAQNCAGFAAWTDVLHDESCTQNKPALCKVTPDTPRNCPEGYSLLSGRCYRPVIWDWADWATARSDCQATGGDLTTINDANELSLVSSLIGNWFLVGYSDQAVEGTWQWIGTSTYTNWAAGEPSGGPAENCGVSDGTGLHDFGCNDSRGYVCEADPL